MARSLLSEAGWRSREVEMGKFKQKESSSLSPFQYPPTHVQTRRRTHTLSSVQFSSVVSNSLRPQGLQHARPPCPSPTPGVDWNSCPLSGWCHPTIHALASPSPPAFNLSQREGLFKWVSAFAWGGQSIGVSASAPVLPKNIQDWFPLGLTGWISLQSKGLSRVFSNTTVQKHQFFGAQLSL